MEEDIIGRIIKKLEELDVYYDNDYFCSNKEPMLLQKEVLAVVEQEHSAEKDQPAEEENITLSGRVKALSGMTGWLLHDAEAYEKGNYSKEALQKKISTLRTELSKLSKSLDREDYER